MEGMMMRVMGVMMKRWKVLVLLILLQEMLLMKISGGPRGGRGSGDDERVGGIGIDEDSSGMRQEGIWMVIGIAAADHT